MTTELIYSHVYAFHPLICFILCQKCQEILLCCRSSYIFYYFLCLFCHAAFCILNKGHEVQKKDKRSVKQVVSARSYWKLNFIIYLKNFNQYLWFCYHPLTDQSGYLLCGFCPLQCCLGNIVSGAVEEERGRAGLQVGHSGYPRRVFGGAQATVQGEGCCHSLLYGWNSSYKCCYSVCGSCDKINLIK